MTLSGGPWSLGKKDRGAPKTVRTRRPLPRHSAALRPGQRHPECPQDVLCWVLFWVTCDQCGRSRPPSPQRSCTLTTCSKNWRSGCHAEPCAKQLPRRCCGLVTRPRSPHLDPRRLGKHQHGPSFSCRPSGASPDHSQPSGRKTVPRLFGNGFSSVLAMSALRVSVLSTVMQTPGLCLSAHFCSHKCF